MSAAADRLRRRRAALLAQAAAERQGLDAGLTRMDEAAARIDRGLVLVRKVATNPVLVAAGVGAVLLLGRGGTRKALASAVGLLGLFLRVRSIGQRLTAASPAQSSGTQSVNRSR